MPEQKNARFKFERITIVTKTLNEQPPDFKGRGDVVHTVDVELKVSSEDKIIGVFTNVLLKTLDDIELAKVETINEFKIDNYEEIIKETDNGDSIVPDDLQALFVPISVSSLRGVLYSHLQGTYLSNAIMPIIFFGDRDDLNTPVADKKLHAA